MKTVEIEQAFEMSNCGRDFADKIANLEVQIRDIERKERTRLYIIRQDWCKENHISTDSSEYNKRYDEDDKKIRALSQPLTDELKKIKGEKKIALDLYVQKVQGNDCWNDLVHRKAAPKILAHLEKNGAKTEVQLVDEIKGKSDHVYSQYCYPLFDMEKLGWIERDGSGTVGDQRLCKLTDLGKKQLESFRKNKKFDINLQNL